MAMILAMMPHIEAWGQYWQFTAPADHHKAAVRITNNGAGISGALVRQGDLVGVLTCAHGLSGGKATVRFSDGTTAQGEFTVDRYRNDVGFIFVNNTNIKPLSVATSAPRQGDQVEFITYGGPLNSLRHFTGRVIGEDSEHTIIDASVVNGDSGGIVVNTAGEVVGVQSVGENGTIAYTTNNWPIYADSGCAKHTPIRLFLSRIRDKLTGGCRIVNGQWVCPNPGYRNPYQPGIGGGGERVDPGQLYPDNNQQNPNPNPGAANDPPPQISINYEKVAEVVYEKVRQDADFFRGPPGQDGKDGIDGKDGAPGEDAKIDLDSISSAVANKIPPITVEIERANGSTDIQEAAPGGIIRIPREAVFYDIVPRGR